jgi:hypothetical protein
VVGGIDICAVGVLEEKQQRQMRQTCVNIAERCKRHTRQKRRTNVPNPTGESVTALDISIFVFFGYQMMDSIPRLQSALSFVLLILNVEVLFKRSYITWNTN